MQTNLKKASLPNKKLFFNQVICNDAIDSLKTIQGENLFDLVIADPPYNIGKDFGNTKDNQIINITYEITSSGPKTPTGKTSIPFARWQEKWGDKLERLNNGFIVFKPTMFSPEYITIP